MNVNITELLEVTLNLETRGLWCARAIHDLVYTLTSPGLTKASGVLFMAANCIDNLQRYELALGIRELVPINEAPTHYHETLEGSGDGSLKIAIYQEGSNKQKHILSGKTASLFLSELNKLKDGNCVAIEKFYLDALDDFYYYKYL